MILQGVQEVRRFPKPTWSWVIFSILFARFCSFILNMPPLLFVFASCVSLLWHKVLASSIVESSDCFRISNRNSAKMIVVTSLYTLYKSQWVSCDRKFVVLHVNSHQFYRFILNNFFPSISPCSIVLIWGFSRLKRKFSF